MPIRFLIWSKPYGRSSNIYGNIIGMPIFFDNLSTNRHLIYILDCLNKKNRDSKTPKIGILYIYSTVSTKK